MSFVRAWLVLAVAVTAFALVLTALAVPTAPLFAGMLGALFFTLLSQKTVTLPKLIFRIAQGVIGVTVGAQVDWGRLKDLGTAWPAVVLVCLATLVLSVAIGQLLRIHRGISVSTATFSTIAGAASGMTAMADDFKADDRVVTVIQYLRVLIILSTLPFVVSWAFDTNATSVEAETGEQHLVEGLLFTALAVFGGLLIGGVLHLPSPAILGGISLGAGLSVVPAFEGVQTPVWVQAFAFLLMGIQVGLKFTPAVLWQLARIMPTAIVVIVLIIVACAGLGHLLSATTGVSKIDGYLATTPGGLPAVLAAATSTGADVTFVTTVQLLRVIIVLVITPFLARWLLKQPND